MRLGRGAPTRGLRGPIETPVTYAQAAAAAAGRNYRTFVSITGSDGGSHKEAFNGPDTDTGMEADAACATLAPDDVKKRQRCVEDLTEVLESS